MDKEGKFLETAWDAFNVALGIKSLKDNIRAGNYLSAVLDGVGVAVDAAATLLPVVPGGASSVIKAGRAADKAVDAAKGIEKGVNASKSGARFISDVDGKIIDTHSTPKGSYLQPDGSRTDVLQDKPHTRKMGKGKLENHGTTHTHEAYENIMPSGEVRKGPS